MKFPLSPITEERLNEIRLLQEQWATHAAAKPHVMQPQLATTYAGELLAYIDYLQTIQPGWTKVSEQLPPAMEGYPYESETVEAWVGNGAMFARFFTKHQVWREEGSSRTMQPTHWRRIVGPPPVFVPGFNLPA